MAVAPVMNNISLSMVRSTTVAEVRHPQMTPDHTSASDGPPRALSSSNLETGLGRWALSHSPPRGRTWLPCWQGRVG